MRKFIVKFICIFVPNKKIRHKIRDLFYPHQNNIKQNLEGYSYGGYCPYKKAKIGKYCSIGPNVVLGPSQHPINLLTTSPITYDNWLGFPRLTSISFLEYIKNHNLNLNTLTPHVTINNDVWIGCNVVIMDGKTIGNGAIIGAGAVVTHDVPPYAIVGGVPAKIIKYRFNEKTIKDLQDVKWWDLPDTFIATLPFNDIKECIKMYREFRKTKYIKSKN